MTHKILTLLVLLPTLSLWGCGGLAGDDDDSAEAGYEVSVTFDGDTVVVDIDSLDTVDFEGTTSVAMTAIVADADVTSPADYTYGFVAFDDYAKDGYLWDDTSQASLEQETGDLQWPEALGMEGEDGVKGVVTIELTSVD